VFEPLFDRIPQWPKLPPPRPDGSRRRRPSALAEGRRELQSTARGDLAQVVIVLPSHFFVAWNDEAQRVALLSSYAKLLATLPESCEVVAVLDASNPARLILAQQFLTTHRPSGAKLMPLPLALGPTQWVRDPFCTVLLSGTPQLVEPAEFIKERPTDWGLADLLGPALGLVVEQGDNIFAGGNVLAGKDHVFVGADSADRIVRMMGESEEGAVTRAFTELEKNGSRTPIVVGTKTQVPNETKPPILQSDRTKHIYHVGNESSRQPIFHIDMFMTLAVRSDDTDVVVLGRPALAREHMPDAWPIDAELDKELQEIATTLRAQGIDVLEIPMPIFGVREAKMLIAFYYAPYSNALVETGSSRRVWLPQFSSTWAAVQTIDDIVAATWRDELGYEVIPIPGCTTFASSPGGLHCATHDTLRVPMQSER